MYDDYVRQAWRFFHTHAGYIVGERALCAWRLALAERHAEAYGVTFEWDGDYGDYHGALGDHAYWCAEERQGIKHAHEVLSCVARDARRNVIASIGGVIDPSREYARVIQAELAVEALEVI